MPIFDRVATWKPRCSNRSLWTCARLACTREGLRPVTAGRGSFVADGVRMCWVSSKPRPPLWLFAFPSPPDSNLTLACGHIVVIVKRAGAGVAPAPLTDSGRLLYHRSKFLRTCVDHVDTGAAPSPVWYHTETTTAMGSIRVVAVWDNNTSATSRHGNIQHMRA